MSNFDIKDSIVRLRELREQLCKERDESLVHDAELVSKDFVVQHLQELHYMIVDRKVRRAKLEKKSAFILDSLCVSCGDDINGDDENA